MLLFYNVRHRAFVLLTWLLWGFFMFDAFLLLNGAACYVIGL